LFVELMLVGAYGHVEIGIEEYGSRDG